MIILTSVKPFTVPGIINIFNDVNGVLSYYGASYTWGYPKSADLGLDLYFIILRFALRQRNTNLLVKVTHELAELITTKHQIRVITPATHNYNPMQVELNTTKQ